MVVIHLLVGAILGMMTLNTATAQSPTTSWSKPISIARTEGQLSLYTFVADNSGHVSLFYVDQPNESLPGAITYLRWDDSGWSQPMEIIVDTETDYPGQPRATIDSEQNVHLIWGGANESLRYAHAPLPEAGTAKGWSRPETLVQSLPSSHDIFAAPNDMLYVVYADVLDLNGAIPDETDQNGVYIISSIDFGRTWSAPTLIAESAPGATASDVRLTMDSADRLHAVWTEYTLPDGWPPIGAFYTRSTDGGVSWDTVQQIAPEQHGQIGVSTVGDDTVHLVWRSTVGGDGTFHQVSTDGGTSWANPDRTDDGGGFSGLPSFAADSIDRLHYVIGPVRYAMWDGTQLSEYLDVATQEVRASVSLSDGEQALLALTSGNRVHVVFETGFQTIWYTSLGLDVPILPTASPSPMRAIGPEPSPTITERFAVAADKPTPFAEHQPMSDSSSPDRMSQSAGILWGVLPALAVIVMVVVAALVRRGR